MSTAGITTTIGTIATTIATSLTMIWLFKEQITLRLGVLSESEGAGRQRTSRNIPRSFRRHAVSRNFLSCFCCLHFLVPGVAVGMC